MHTRRNLRAVVAITLATALFSLVYASAKFADGAAAAVQILWLRYVGGLTTLLAVTAVTRRPLRLYRSPRPGAHMLRAILGATGGGCFIYASAHMPIVDATAIGLLQAAIFVALGVAVLGERIGRRQGAGMAACLIGAVIIVASRGAFTDLRIGYLLPAVVALAGAVLVALEGLFIKRLSQAEKPMAVLLHVNAFGIGLMAVPAALAWQPLDLAAALPFLLLGPVAVLAQYLTVIGYRDADAAIVGPIDYTWLIFAAAIGWLFFGEVPTGWVIAGAIVIIVGGTVLATCRPRRATGPTKKAGPQRARLAKIRN